MSSVDYDTESVDSPTSPRFKSPSGLSGTASPSALVLLPDNERQDPYDLDSDDDTGENHDPQLEIKKLYIPPLPPSCVFLYLLLPYLRLGVLYVSDSSISLLYGILLLGFAMSLSTFCRHLWFMLGRYLHKATLNDILVETFVRGRGQRCQHSFVRGLLNGAVALYMVFLAAVYMQDLVESVLPLVPEDLQPYSRLTISALLGFVVYVISTSNSLAAKPVIYSSSFSLASYLAWLIAVSHSYATGKLQPVASLSQRGVLWNGYSSIVFGCTTSLTVHLYASLTTTPTTMPAKEHRARLFELLNVSSTALAMLLTLPLVILASSRTNIIVRQGTAGTLYNFLVPALRALTLLLSIPSVILSTPAPRNSCIMFHCSSVNLARVLNVIVVVVLSLSSTSVLNTLRDIVLVSACCGTFLLPGLAHITIHYLRRPMVIIVPQAPHVIPDTRHSSRAGSISRPSLDPLLQRKERALQRRRLGKRLLWDVGIWLVLMPACICSIFWAVGRVVGKW
ncbi:hypothetical protein ID866_4390 [Astraeus odoratus]|nr:hypothetical protein ID866_4390 [Astraeus odoratus]